MKEIFETLSVINLSDKIEIKDVAGKKLSYISWANAWAELQKEFPGATFEVERFGFDNAMYLFDENLGYMVGTKMNINGVERSMTLPVLDGANKAMKNTEYVSGKRTVQSATMFDINTAIMRCLVKNIALYGLGLYLYAGEDLPEYEAINKAKEDCKKYRFSAGKFAGQFLNEIEDIDGLAAILSNYSKEMGPALSAAIDDRLCFLNMQLNGN